MFNYFKKKIILLLIISIFSVNAAYFSAPISASAIPVVDAPHATVTIFNQGWQVLKQIGERGFAAIIKAAVRKLILDMTNSIVNWIKGGKGRPAFVSQPLKFLKDSADLAIGDFIQNNPDLNFLCAPFRFQIKLGLALNYSANVQQQIGCTLSQVAKNIKYGVRNGIYGAELNINGRDYAVSYFKAQNGSWKGWYNKTLVPQNDPVTMAYATKAMLDQNIQNTRLEGSYDLGFGQGALSFNTCKDTYYDQSGNKVGSSDEYTKGAGETTKPKAPANVKTVTNCVVKTPGAVITSMINGTALTDLRSTEYGAMVADGLDTIFSTFVTTMLDRMNGKLKKGVLGDTRVEDAAYMNAVYSGTFTWLNNLNNQSVDVNNQLNSLQNIDWDNFNPNDSVPNTDTTPIEIPQWTWIPPDGTTSVPWINIGTTTESTPNYPYTYSTSTGLWIENHDFMGGQLYGRSALDQAKTNANTLINSLSASEFAYQNNYKIAQNVLTAAREVFATSSACNLSYNGNTYILRSLLIRANVITNIDGVQSSDRTIASIPWNLQSSTAALADSNTKLQLLSKASQDVNGAASITAVQDAMTPVNSTSFNTDPQAKMVGNIKTWLVSVQGLYNSIFCPIDLTKVLQINSATSTVK